MDGVRHRIRLLLLTACLLLAGCAHPAADSPTAAAPETRSSSTQFPASPGAGFAPQGGHVLAEANGVRVEVTWQGCEAGWCVSAVALNNGTSTYQISSICEPAWHDAMKHEGAAVQHREGAAMCEAYGRAPFAPGDKNSFEVTWDQRVWTEGTARPAPEGAYQWSIVFWYEESEGGPRLDTTINLDLRVGET